MLFTGEEYERRKQQNNRPRINAATKQPYPEQLPIHRHIQHSVKDDFSDILTTGKISLLVDDLNELLKYHEAKAGAQLKSQNIPGLDTIDSSLLGYMDENKVLFSDLTANFPNFDLALSSANDSDDNPPPGSFDHMKYLRYFWNYKSSLFLPFTEDAYPAFKVILLSYAKDYPYLLAALLSSGANGIYGDSPSVLDETAHYAYLSCCLKLLGTSLADEKALGGQPGPLILTILVLCSEDASARSSHWRTHMAGAMDLLKRSSSYRTETESSSSSGSLVLTMCRVWFASLDIIAGLTVQDGGVLTNEEDIDFIIDADSPKSISQMNQLGLLTGNGFNRFHAFHNSALPIFRNLYKMITRVRKDPDTTIPYNEIVPLLKEVEDLRGYGEISTNCIIPDDFDLSVYPESAYGTIVLEDQTEVKYSWRDICHQASLQTALLIILSRKEFFGLPNSHPWIIEGVEKLLSFFIFAKDKNFKNRSLPFSERYRHLTTQYVVFHLHYMVLVAGLLANKHLHRLAIKDVFDIFIYIGSPPAKKSWERLEGIWKAGGQVGCDADVFPF